MSGNYVIAGGSKGIGLELVNRLAEDGNSVDVYSREVDELTVTDRISHRQCDFTAAEIQLYELPDSIQGVAYCPGSINLRSFRSLKVEDFRKDLELNLLGAVKFLQACLPALKRNPELPSSILLFSTVAVGQGMAMHSSVAACKGAIEGLTRSLAAELAPKIRVNCIAPALTDTPLAARFFASEESRNVMAAKYPLARTGLVTDIAEMGQFLLSGKAGWITGQTIGVDGGMSAVRMA